MKTCPICGSKYADHTVYCPLDGNKLEADLSADVYLGQVIENRYEIRREIDRGPTGTVYEGLDKVAGRPVALKITRLREQQAQQISLFREQLHQVMGLSHPGLMEIYDLVLLSPQEALIVMEYLAGESLQKEIAERGALPLLSALSLIEQILRAVAALHQLGIVHNNLRPATILLGLDHPPLPRVKVAGFVPQLNVSSSLEGAMASAARTGNYTAPEILLGGFPDTRSDVYSLGIIFYEMLSGVLPFPPGNMLAYYANPKAPAPPSLRRLKPYLHIPKSLERSILQALQRDPSRRFKRASEFLQEILALQKRHPLRRFAWPATLLLLGVFLIASWGWFGRAYWQAILSSSETVGVVHATDEVQARVSPGEAAKQSFEASKAQMGKLPPQSEKEALLDMIYIHGAMAQIGALRGTGDADETVRTVEIAPFYIDRSEVTNEQYHRFLKATGHSAPAHWKEGSYPAGQEKFPVVQVSWYDAVLFCHWAGKRLPTEYEWEYACRAQRIGNQWTWQELIWPWGTTWVANACNVGTSQTQAVGSFPKGNSALGLQDLSGNVWEWTNSWMDEAAQDHVIRGGSFRSTSYQARITFRDGFLPYSRRDDLGFRCVKDVQ